MGVVGETDHRATHDVVGLELAPVFFVDGDGAVLVERDKGVIGRLDGAQVIVMNDPGSLGLDDGLLEGTRSDPTDVERTHRELRAGLADGLGGDDADRFADLGHAIGGEVHAVALRTATTAAFAGENRTDLELLVTDVVEAEGNGLVDHLSRADDDFFAVDHLLGRNAAVDPGLQVDDFLVTFVDGLHENPVGSAAIDFGDDDILGHVDEFPRHVSRVGRLERGIGKTLAGSVGGDEILKHRQTRTEVRDDGALDDLA